VPPGAGNRRYERSADYMASARRLLVRGVSSAMREAQRPTPLAIERGTGSTLVDEDGNAYVDYVLGFGPLLLGHRPPGVIAAVREQLDRGVLFGAQHRGEAELAGRLIELVPSAEMVAISTSGSEAVQAAIRLARATTGRTLVVKFDGHYHGWIDPVYVNGPGMAPGEPATHAVPGLSPPPGVLTCRWNDLEAITHLLAEHEGRVAAVIMEPVACNFGNLEPLPGYLAAVRRLCDRHGTVLIFDEVITGFRLAPGGAQERYGVEPHLTVLAKAVASGFPLSAVTGTAEVMAVAHGAGPVRHIGTYNGNPISVVAANATLETLARGGAALYADLEARSARLARGLRDAARARGAPLVVNQVGSVLHLLWGAEEAARHYDDAFRSDRAAIADLAAHLLGAGIFVTERGLWFVSTAHSDTDVDRTIAAATDALAAVVATRR
jgi:glutamate-1-semialdehyde 2,1-aminomutase